MRVALLSFDFGDFCIGLANGLAEQAEVLLILPQQLLAPGQARLSSSVKVFSFPKPRLRQPIRQVIAAARIHRALRSFGPDILHYQHGHLWFNFTLPLLGDLPLVVTIHDPERHVGDRESLRIPQWTMDFGYRRAHRAIVHAQTLRDEVVERLGFPAEAVHVVPLADPGVANRGTQESDGKVALFFGRIWGYKGLEYLIRAEPLITAQVPDAKIVIAGTGEDFDRYRQMMVHPDRFEVHNEYVTDAKRDELFGRASVVVLPYVEATQSGVVPVAYGYGKPVVATTVGGLPEVVEHGRTGLLVPPRNEAALAHAVVSLLSDPERAREMGRRGKEKLRQECSPQAVGQRTMEVYRAALADHRERLGARARRGGAR
jgi:starch synthase